jgi:DNA-binding CsgD family transcriptional regulator
MRPGIVGRTVEQQAVRELLDDAVPRMRALVIDGEAGMGKTTLWLWGVEEARRDWTVLIARPAEGESSLPFAALGDLLEPTLDDTDGLSDAHRAALDLALQRTQVGEPATRLALSRAVLALLRSTADQRRLVVAIDDAQWLDVPTEQVLEFAFRRVDDSQIRLLIARRTEQELPAPLGLDRASASDGVGQLKLGPMSLDELGVVLRERLGLALARPRLAELHAACAGNPFYALEIGRALRAVDLEGGEPLPVPESLSVLLRRRLETLPEAAQFAALLAAASPNPTAAVVERAAGGSDGLAVAVDVGVLELDGRRLRFTHPLLASTTYSAAPPWERRGAHARLAREAENSLERAHHLARSMTEPDETVAAELSAAATDAAARGAPETAGALMERAADLTPPAHADEWRRRRIEAAQHHLASGDPARSRTILAGVVGSLPPGRDRAAVLWRLADLTEPPEVSIELCEQALAESGGDQGLDTQIRITLATLTWITGDVPRSIRMNQSAMESAKRAGDGLVEALAIGALCYQLMILGRPFPAAEMERALDLEAHHDGFPANQRPSFRLGLIHAYTDRPDQARPLLQAELQRLERAGNDSWQISVLLRLADVELRAGNWSEAARLARRSMEIGLSAGTTQQCASGQMIHGLVQAHLGELEQALSAARTALALCEEEGDTPYAIRASAVLGFAELSRGDALTALAHLGPASRELRRMDIGELSVSQVVHNEIDALIALGRLGEAEETIDFVEEKGRPTDRAWHAAIAARGRALVASARGDHDLAREHLDRALAAHDRLPQPFELGRTLLAQGTIERRAKRRAAARASLSDALEIFDQLGAPLWAEKAAAELARIPGRGRASDELSETERRVAELVASGLSNKAVAAKLFITVRTVESNLTRIYAKLGVRSRTELAARIGDWHASAPPSSGGIRQPKSASARPD